MSLKVETQIFKMTVMRTLNLMWIGHIMADTCVGSRQHLETVNFAQLQKLLLSVSKTVDNELWWYYLYTLQSLDVLL